MVSKYLSSWHNLSGDLASDTSWTYLRRLEYFMVHIFNLVLWILLSCWLTFLKPCNYFIFDKLKFAKDQGGKRCHPTLMSLKHLFMSISTPGASEKHQYLNNHCFLSVFERRGWWQPRRCGTPGEWRPSFIQEEAALWFQRRQHSGLCNEMGNSFCVWNGGRKTPELCLRWAHVYMNAMSSRISWRGFFFLKY